MNFEIIIDTKTKWLTITVNMICNGDCSETDSWSFQFTNGPFPIEDWRNLLQKMENPKSNVEFYIGNNGKYGESSWEISLSDKCFILSHRIRSKTLEFVSVRSRKIDIMIPVIKEIIRLLEVQNIVELVKIEVVKKECEGHENGEDYEGCKCQDDEVYEEICYF